jgi:branched-subunit amino acid ABC-type transport system permease component
MAFYVVQFLTGLASAASLFLVASGLSIIFGVTRIVNFAHGAFYMLGAYVAFTLTERFSGALGFWGGIVVAALAVAAIGVLVEMVLLRRIYHAPELFQLLATFGLTLMVEDLVVLIWGPSDLLGRRAPGFKGAVDFFGQNIPTYDLFLIVLSPIVLGLLWLMFQRTRWGVLVRAATQDRDMVAALGVNQKWLFTSVFALGVFLAALGGALQIPRASRARPAHHRRRVRGGRDRWPRQHHRRLCRGGAGLRAQCLRHSDFSKNIHHPGVPGDGRGADRAAVGPVRKTGGAGAAHARADRQSLAATDDE